MKQKSPFLILVFLCVFILTACSTNMQTEESLPVIQPSETDDADGPVLMVDFLEGSEVIRSDDLSQDSGESLSGERYAVSEGVFRMTPEGDQFAYLSSPHAFQSGQAVMALVRFESGTQFESAMDVGMWDSPDYKRWGMYQLEELSTNVMFGRESGDIPETYSGSFKFLPDRWYYLLFIVQDSQGVQVIWEKGAPESSAQYQISFEPDWQGQDWSFFLQVFQGNLEIDEFFILRGDFPQFNTEEASTPVEVPDITEEVPSPTETAEIVFLNGSVLTIDESNPRVEALALKDGVILAVGSNEEIQPWIDGETIQIDLEGHTLMPGFIDPHTHIFDSGQSIMGISIEQTQQVALENGVTSMGGFFNDQELQTLQDMAVNGTLQIRAHAYLYATGACGEDYGQWYLAYPPSRPPGGKLWINGIKVFTDGGTCEYPAVSQETHPGAGQGNLWFTDQGLLDLIEPAHANGYQVAIHALGDRAIRQAQDAIFAVNGDAQNQQRHRIEHNYYLSDDLIPRFREYGILPVIFGQFPTCAAVNLDRTAYWQQTIARWREVLDQNPGLPIAAKSDTPYVGIESPLISLYSLTTFREVGEDGSICEPPAWLAARAITIQEALPMITYNAAYDLFREAEIGSLEPGKMADIVILNQNPLDMAAEDLIGLKVWMTMVGGEVKFCAAGMEGYCP